MLNFEVDWRTWLNDLPVAPDPKDIKRGLKSLSNCDGAAHQFETIISDDEDVPSLITQVNREISDSIEEGAALIDTLSETVDAQAQTLSHYRDLIVDLLTEQNAIVTTSPGYQKEVVHWMHENMQDDYFFYEVEGYTVYVLTSDRDRVAAQLRFG